MERKVDDDVKKIGSLGDGSSLLSLGFLGYAS